MMIVKYISCLVFCALLSTPAVAGIWQLETTTLPPKEEYPKGVVTENFEQILRTYNIYMTAFSESDFHTMADQMDLTSPSLRWNNRLDVIDNFSFIKAHILEDYSYSDVSNISFITNAVGDHILWVKRSDKNSDGAELYKSYVMYGFKQINEGWKISSIINMTSLTSPF